MSDLGSAVDYLLRAIFERAGSAVQYRQGFAGEMERAGDQDGLGIRASGFQGVGKVWNNGVGECRSNDGKVRGQLVRRQGTFGADVGEDETGCDRRENAANT